MLNNGVDPNSPFQCHAPHPLRLAVLRGNSAILKLLVDSGANPNRYEDQISPLSLAVFRTKEVSALIIKILLDAGANADGQFNSNYHHQIPLFGAIKARNAVAARLLIATGATVNLVVPGRRTPLQAAISEDDITMIKLL